MQMTNDFLAPWDLKRARNAVCATLKQTLGSICLPILLFAILLFDWFGPVEDVTPSVTWRHVADTSWMTYKKRKNKSAIPIGPTLHYVSDDVASLDCATSSMMWHF